MRRIPTFFSLTAFLVMLAGSALLAQGDPDSGWVQLWDGETWDGLTVHLRNATELVDPADQERFFLDDGFIITTTGKKGNAHLYTIEEHSYYHVRIHYRFTDDADGSSNAGLIVHADLSQIPDLTDADNRPASIEVNMRRQNDSPWTLWAARNLGPYITSTGVEGTFDYLSENDGGVEFTIDPWRGWTGTDADRVVYSSYPNPEYDINSEWNLGEAIVMGDSGIFILNGQERTKGWNFQVRNPENPDDESVENRIPYTKGSIGLQYEIDQITYKNWELRSLIGCMDPEAENYKSWYVIDEDPSACIVSSVDDRNRNLLPQHGVVNVRNKTLKVTAPGEHVLAILDLSGKNIYQQTGTEGALHDFSSVKKPGLYVFRLQTDGSGMYTMKQTLF